MAVNLDWSNCGPIERGWPDCDLCGGQGYTRAIHGNYPCLRCKNRGSFDKWYDDAKRSFPPFKSTYNPKPVKDDA